MGITCWGCAHYWVTMIRRQWNRLCRLTGKTAPLRICLCFKPKNG